MKNLLKKIYRKLNPVFVVSRRNEDILNSINIRIANIENKLDSVIKADNSSRNFERVLLFTEPKIFRYLYINRYIKTGDEILDIDCEYGAGANLLSEVSPVGKITCINSIEHFSNLGRFYYSNDLLNFTNGTIEDVQEKFQIILALNSNSSSLLPESSFSKIYDCLDLDGVFAVAVNLQETYGDERSLPELLKQSGFVIEEILYQGVGFERFETELKKDSVQIVIARKRS